jgi:hypothetical protein
MLKFMLSKESRADFFHSDLFTHIVAIVGGVLVAVFIFEAGVAVGYHEATFSSRWGENYERNFGGPGHGFHKFFGLPGNNLPNPNGAFGKIISITASSTDATTLIVASDQKPEQKVLISSTTILRSQENTVGLDALKVGSYVVVLGTPDNSGEILASLVRLLPFPPPLK